MKNQSPHRIKTVSEYHRFRGLPAPEHPLVSVVDISLVKRLRADEPQRLVTDLYVVALKHNVNARMHYGQQAYDFDGGALSFVAPGQVFGIRAEDGVELTHTGWVLLFHPDLLWNTPLAQHIKRYDYFGYAANEALHLSDKEEAMLVNILQNIAQENRSAVDKFSQEIIVAQLESFFAYAERFYQRQFITRKKNGHQILERLEEWLAAAFDGDDLVQKGIPTVTDAMIPGTGR